MVFAKWNSSMSVGVKEIDEQHKNLMRLVNKAHNLKKEKESLEELKNILSELVEFTRIHFATEEKYFEEFKCKNVSKHIEEHNKITLKMLKFWDRFGKEKLKIIDDFLEFLRDWLETHFKIMDHQYIKCFHNHGLR